MILTNVLKVIPTRGSLSVCDMLICILVVGIGSFYFLYTECIESSVLLTLISLNFLPAKTKDKGSDLSNNSVQNQLWYLICAKSDAIA